jgi:catechol 2,3-dioxygenase
VTTPAPELIQLDDRTTFRPSLHHVNLKTTRLAEMADWYALVLGMKPNFRSDMMVFLSNDDANHRIALGGLPGFEVDADRVKHDGLHHVAFEYGSLDELLGTYVRLKADRVLPHMALDHGVTVSFYYLDPDGNSVELQFDPFGDWTESTRFMRSDPRFAAKGLGEFVDPDALVELRRNGASPDEIHRRAYAGELPPTVPPDVRIPLPASS